MNMLAALALASFVAAPVPKGAGTNPDKEAIQGEWKIVTDVRDGKDRTREFAGVPVTIKDNTISFKIGKRDETQPFAIDPKADPKTIDLLPEVNDGKAPTFPGIYKLEKDKLTICFSTRLRFDRPKEFKSEKGSSVSLLVLERMKK
jgi:uncharacterized protein (TIGR03067 family)